MAEIVLSRVDSRLIHGQVMTKWIKQMSANTIVVVSDELAEDEFMRDVYLMSAPEGIRIDVYSTQQAVDQWNTDQFGDGRVLLLAPSVQVITSLIENGLPLSEIQIGGMGAAPGRKVIYQNITLDDADAEKLQYLLDKGIKINFQVIPEDTPRDGKSVLALYK